MQTKQPKNFLNVLFVVEDLGNIILKKIQDYENIIHDNPELKRKFFNIDFVYMHSILLDLGKLLSVTGSDKSTLSELKKISPKKYKTQIIDLEDKYKNTIIKIASNRNKIIAHVDISDLGSYFNMGFSDAEIKRKVDDYIKAATQFGGILIEADLSTIAHIKELKSKSFKLERFSPVDFYDEREILKEIVNQILRIGREINYYYYSPS